MLKVNRQRVGQGEDVCLAAGLTFTYENEVPEDMVDVNQAHFDSSTSPDHDQ